MSKKITKNNTRAINKAVESLDALLTKFGEYYGKSIEMLVAAAKVYATAIDEYGDEAKIAFVGDFPQIDKKAWSLLIKIARREASPKLFTMASAYRVKKIGALPYETQVEVLGEVGQEPKPLPVISRGSVINKPMNDMNSSEINSVIDTNANRIRSVEEQIAAAAASLAARNALPKWEVADGVLSVHRSCIIGGEDLIRLYDEVGQIVKAMKKVRAA